MVYAGREINASLPTLGLHLMENAALASAMAIAAGATDQAIIQGLEAASIEPGRMTPIQMGQTLLIDDTYNASPQAVRAAIDWLATRSFAPASRTRGRWLAPASPERRASCPTLASVFLIEETEVRDVSVVGADGTEVDLCRVD